MAVEVTNINDLHHFLSNLPSQVNNNKQIDFSTKMQIQALESLQSIEAGTYAIDNILDLLKESVRYSVDEREARFYQHQASNMIQSIFLFASAKVELLQKAHADSSKHIFDRGIDLFMRGFSSVMNIASELVNTTDKNFWISFDFSKTVKKCLAEGVKHGEEIASNIKGFVNGVRAKRQARRELVNSQIQLDNLKEAFLKKGIEYRELFGDSIVFKELLDEFHYIPEVDYSFKPFIKRIVFLDLSFFLCAFLSTRTLQSSFPAFITIGVIAGLIEVLFLVLSIYSYNKIGKMKDELDEKFKLLKNGSINGDEYIMKENNYIKSLSGFYKIDNLVMGFINFFSSFIPLLIGSGLVIFLWNINTNGFLVFLLRVLAVLVSIVTAVVEAIVLFVKNLSK